MDIDFMEYIQPGLFIMIPVLIGIGKIFKESTNKKSHKHIPLFLMIISVILSCLWLIVINDDSVGYALLMGFIQGGLIASVAVFGNQVFKQYTKKDE